MLEHSPFKLKRHHLQRSFSQLANDENSTLLKHTTTGGSEWTTYLTSIFQHETLMRGCLYKIKLLSYRVVTYLALILVLKLSYSNLSYYSTVSIIWLHVTPASSVIRHLCGGAKSVLSLLTYRTEFVSKRQNSSVSSALIVDGGGRFWVTRLY